jgi:hypothetical protein
VLLLVALQYRKLQKFASVKCHTFLLKYIGSLINFILLLTKRRASCKDWDSVIPWAGL